MVAPDGYSYSVISKYVGVITAQIAATLFIYIVLKIIHFLVWGYMSIGKEGESKPPPQADQRRWDQQSWDISFPIIFANHVIACAMPLLYMPHVFTCVIAFVHFGCFFALVIVNIFIRDLEPGRGTRTTISRGIWGLMCVLNIVLFVSGLARIRRVIGG